MAKPEGLFGYHRMSTRKLPFNGSITSRKLHKRKHRQCLTAVVIEYRILLHIMCGYQCDKAVNKNDTREVI